MKGNEKRNRMAVVIPVLLYIAAVICLFWFHPFVASAKEDDAAAKKVPGGKGNKVHIYSVTTNSYFNTKNVIDRSLAAKDNVEIVGYFRDMTSRMDLCIAFVSDDEGLVYAQDAEGYLSDYVGVEMKYKNNVLDSTVAFGSKRIIEFAVMYYVDDKNNTAECTYTGMKVFKDVDALREYADTGSLDGLVKDEVDRNWYLKDIRMKYNKNGSPDPTADADVATLDFSWLTENLHEGDLLEVKTHNYVVKLGGDRISGFLDYVTYQDHVSCLNDIYTDDKDNERSLYKIGRYAASRAWLNTLENKPLISKDYDTDIYYMRPYRDGKVGLWCKLTMGRRSNGDPYIAKREYGDLDDDDDFHRDDDVTEKEGGDHGIDEDGNDIDPVVDNPFDGFGLTELFKSFFDFMKGLPSLMGDLPELVKTIVGFLPDWVIGFIAISIVVVIILRLLGR